MHPPDILITNRISQGFLPKALLLGIGQTIGYMVFSEALGFYSEALKPRAAAADESDANADQ
jgi:hypothetical protein